MIQSKNDNALLFFLHCCASLVSGVILKPLDTGCTSISLLGATCGAISLSRLSRLYHSLP